MTNKPWRHAKPGDLWILTLDGGETRSAAVYQHIHDGLLYFKGEGISTLLTDHHVVGGRRIYPEAEPQPIDLVREIQAVIYSLYGSVGRDVSAETLASGIARVLEAKLTFVALDPEPWVSYDGETVTHRDRSQGEEHSAFLPRYGYEQRLEKYWGVRPGAVLDKDNEPWIDVDTGHRSGLRGGVTSRFDPRPGYNQNRGLYA